MKAADLAVGLIEAYRKYLSPMKMQCCRFYPSCSQYAIDAITQYGIARGAFKAVKRVLRCHPFTEGGFDPVK